MQEESKVNFLLILAKFGWPSQVTPSPNRLPEETRPQAKQSVFPCTFTWDAALQKALATAWRETKVALEALTQAQ